MLLFLSLGSSLLPLFSFLKKSVVSGNFLEGGDEAMRRSIFTHSSLSHPHFSQQAAAVAEISIGIFYPPFTHEREIIVSMVGKVSYKYS